MRKPSLRPPQKPTHREQPDSGFGRVAERRSFVCLLLVLVTFAVFSPVVGYDFINLDDVGYLVENPHVQLGLTWKGVVWALGTGLGGNWHPLTWLSWMLDAQVFGLNPGGFHLTNLALHIAAAVLLFLVLRQLTGAHWRSAVVAGLFALHPLHVESVAWIAERKDVLSTLFFMLTLWAYARFAQGSAKHQASGVRTDASRITHHATCRFPSSILHPPSSFYFLSLLCFAFGLMSKPMLVTLPFVLLLLDYWPLRRFASATRHSPLAVLWHLLWEKLPFFILTGTVSVITFLIQTNAGAAAPTAELPLAARLGNAVVSYARYLGKTFWPFDLALPYPHPTYWPVSEVILAAAIVAGSSVAALWFARKLPFLVTGWFWFLGTLIPVIGLVQVGMQSMADRYTYVPLIGMFLLLVWTAHTALTRWKLPRARAIAGGILSALVLLACAVRTANQVRLWRDSGILFQHAIGVTKDNDLAYNCFGMYLAGRGYENAALDYYRKSLHLNPRNLGVLTNLGATLAAIEKADQATGHRRGMLRPKSYYADSYNDLGVVLAGEKRFDEAIDQYTKALNLAPDHAQAHNNLGLALTEKDRLADAVEHFQTALRYQPEYANAHANLGRALARQGKFTSAIPHFTEALRLEPGHLAARRSLGLVLIKVDRRQEAIECLTEVLRRDPKDQEAKQALIAMGVQPPASGLSSFDNPNERSPAKLPSGNSAAETCRLGDALLRQAKPSEAIAKYREALRLQPDSVETLNRMAWVLATHTNATVRNGAEAVRLAERAAELTRHNDAGTLDVLAAAYAETGRFTEAAKVAQAASDDTETEGRKDLAAQIRERIKGYRSERPFRE